MARHPTTGKPVCGASRRRGDDGERAARGTGKPCLRPAGWGTPHLGHGRCKLHGGSTEAGAKRAQVEAAVDAMNTYGVQNPIPTDPVAGLLEEIARTAGHIHWLELELAKLEPKALTEGVRSLSRTTGGQWGGETTVVNGPGVHTLLELYHVERRHFVNVCGKAVAANISEREIRLAERQGNVVGDAVMVLLEGLGLTEDQRGRVPDLVDAYLHRVYGDLERAA